MNGHSWSPVVRMCAFARPPFWATLLSRRLPVPTSRRRWPSISVRVERASKQANPFNLEREKVKIPMHPNWESHGRARNSGRAYVSPRNRAPSPLPVARTLAPTLSLVAPTWELGCWSSAFSRAFECEKHCARRTHERAARASGHVTRMEMHVIARGNRTKWECDCPLSRRRERPVWEGPIWERPSAPYGAMNTSPSAHFFSSSVRDSHTEPANRARLREPPSAPNKESFSLGLPPWSPSLPSHWACLHNSPSRARLTFVHCIRVLAPFFAAGQRARGKNRNRNRGQEFACCCSGSRVQLQYADAAHVMSMPQPVVQRAVHFLAIARSRRRPSRLASSLSSSFAFAARCPSERARRRSRIAESRCSGRYVFDSRYRAHFRFLPLVV